MRLLLIAALCLFAGACVSPAEPPETGTAITGATIYAAPDAAPVPGGVILIHDGRILSAGPAGSVAVPAGFEIIDGRGLFAVAGYWNSHAHLVGEDMTDPAGASDDDLSAYFTNAYVRHGFTTLVDLASETRLALGVASRIDTSDIKAPRLLTAGSPFYPPGGTPIYARPIYEAYGLPSAEIVDAESAVARLEAQADAGARAVKLFTGAIVGEPIGVMPMADEHVRALTDAARRKGLPVFAHPTDTEGLRVAVENGVDILAHAAPLSGDWTDGRAADMAQRGIGMTPTLHLFELFPHPATPVELAVAQAAALQAAGGDILFGTDAGFSPGYDPAGEWALMHRFMDWRGLLAAMTTVPARRLGEAGERGEIAAGQVADIVLLGADPAEDFRHLGAAVLVMKDGRIIFERGE
ncbi:MAG: amidohydrolase family protein [Hyphomonas sp.]